MDSGVGSVSAIIDSVNRTDGGGIEDAHAYVANEIMQEGKHLSKLNDYKTFTQVQK